jgi:hypothetical protein
MKWDFEGFRPKNITKQGIPTKEPAGDAFRTTGDLFMGRMNRKQQQQDALPGDPHAEVKPDQSGAAPKQGGISEQKYKRRRSVILGNSGDSNKASTILGG